MLGVLHFFSVDIRRAWSVLAVSIALIGVGTDVQAQTPPSTAKLVAEKAEAAALDRDKALWHKTMVAVPTPSKGCHKATYPVLQWVAVPCTQGSNTPRTSPNRKAKLAVGGGTLDFAATRPTTSNSTITQAIGSFDQVITTGEVNRSSGPNPVDTRRSEFELQLNTNTFKSGKCGRVKGCVGWEQFVLMNDPGSPPAILQIQTWLLNLAASGCPAPFEQAGAHCALLSEAMSVNIQNIASLVPLVMIGKAEANGNDTVIVSGTGEDAISAVSSDSLLNLAANWITAEFNVFGDNTGHIAVFDPGSTLVVRVMTTFADGSTPISTLVNLTGESNNLNLVKPACSTGSPFLALTFKETNLNGESYPCPPNPPPQNLCADDTEEVAFDQKSLANAQQALRTPLCEGPASFNCVQTVKSIQQKLQRDQAAKTAACK